MVAKAPEVINQAGVANKSSLHEWDFLFIGAMADHMGYKRPWKIGEKTGRRLAVGKQDNDEAQKIVADLRTKGVQVLEPVPYGELAELIRSSRTVYVPDHVLGGGERAVLEA